MLKLPTIFGRKEASCVPTVRRLITKFETTVSVLTVKSPKLKPSRQTEKQLVLEQDSVTVSPGKPIRLCSQQLDNSTS